ncbi:MAG: aminotransferase class I/II-fold pyridoxal phosphate-dependent enzyme [Bacillota bacterium]|nr:aminotransferase class I/II-fold pyridoxal phosphate-dependent enzyme [Bacillota bacterium]
MEERVYLSSPTMHQDEMRFIQEAFDTNWVAPLGPNVDQFEKEVAEYLDVRASLALVSGTAALHLIVRLAGVSRDDIVLCSDLTFAATVNPVSYENGTQVFIDSERDSWNMDPLALEKALKYYDGNSYERRKPKAVMLAHLYGSPAKLDEIIALCEKYDVPLMEDAAESLGATYKGKQTGGFGVHAAISFNGNKIITTSGGGMLLSSDEEAVRKARFWSTQARDPAPWYQHSELGYNYRMSNVVAGIGRGQLMWLDEHKRLKKEIYLRYLSGLQGLPLSMNPYLKESEPNFWLSCALINQGCKVTPMDVLNRLNEHNIEGRPLWKPMHLQPYYAKNAFFTANEEDVGADLFSRGFCLPSDIKMTPETQERVIEIIRSCF